MYLLFYLGVGEICLRYVLCMESIMNYEVLLIMSDLVVKLRCDVKLRCAFHECVGVVFEVVCYV
jgi:hypothetical protein